MDEERFGNPVQLLTTHSLVPIYQLTVKYSSCALSNSIQCQYGVHI